MFFHLTSFFFVVPSSVIFFRTNFSHSFSARTFPSLCIVLLFKWLHLFAANWTQHNKWHAREKKGDKMETISVFSVSCEYLLRIYYLFSLKDYWTSSIRCNIYAVNACARHSFQCEFSAFNNAFDVHSLITLSIYFLAGWDLALTNISNVSVSSIYCVFMCVCVCVTDETEYVRICGFSCQSFNVVYRIIFWSGKPFPFDLVEPNDVPIVLHWHWNNCCLC